MTVENRLNLILEKTLDLFLKSPPLKKILIFYDGKKTVKLIHKKTLNQNLNQRLKTYQMKFIY